jgi:hypothetical protein
MTLAFGTRLGPYEIVSPLGAVGRVRCIAHWGICSLEHL